MDLSSTLRHALRALQLLGSVLLARQSTRGCSGGIFGKETVDVGRLGGSAMAYFALGRKADSDAARRADD